MLFFYLRHGDPIYDPDSLTPKGRRQAESLSKRLCQFGLDRIYTSSSIRAMQTAEPTCELTGLKPVVLDWCNEHYGYMNLSVVNSKGIRKWIFLEEEYEALMVSPEVRALGDRWFDHPKLNDPRFEPYMKAVAENVANFFAGLGYEYDKSKNLYRCVKPTDERVALFAHEGCGMSFLSAMLGIPYPEFAMHFTMGHTGMTVIEFADHGGWCAPRMLQLGSDAHLYRDGLPLHYQNRMYF